MPRKARILLAVTFILVGAAVFFYPKLNGLYSQRKAEQTLSSVGQLQATRGETVPSTPRQTVPAGEDAATTPAAVSDGDGSATTPATVPSEPSEMELLYQELVEYNQRIWEEGQQNLRDPFSYQTPAIDLTAYGFTENVIGALWIPRMEVELPVYLGATGKNMAQGAAVLGETSLPVSGENTNVVIAGHRGYGGAAMFRDIQLLQIGDKITLTTPWEKLVYRVCLLEIIYPDDSDAILIQPGRQLLTLLTCHPYTQNYQRYMVVAERSDEPAEQTRQEELEEAARTFDDKPRAVRLREENGESSVIQVEPKGIRMGDAEESETGAAYSNLQIVLEKYAPPVVLTLLGLLLAVMLLRKRRKKQ